MVASILERTGARLVHNRAGANMAGGIACALAERLAHGRPRADRRLRPLRGRRVLARPGRRGARAARDAARQPVPRPARPLRRAGDDRRPLGRDRRRPRRRSCSTPTTRSSPTSAATRRTRLLRRRRRLARAPRAPARLGLQALPPLRPRLHVRGRLPRPPRPLPLPELRPGAPGADRRGHRRRAARHQHRRVHAARARASSSRSPASTTSTTRSAPPRSRSRLGVELDDVVAGLEAVAPAFGRAETLDLAAARPRSCWSRTRPAPTRCCGRSRWRAASSTCSACSTTGSPTAATSRWVWDADWELLVGRVRRFTCSGTRAAELALRMKYAGLDPDRIHVVDDLEQGLDAALARRRRPALRRPHLHRAARAARAADPPRPGGGVLAMSSEHAVWHDVECGRYDADLPLWQRARARGRARRARRRRRHRPRRAAARRRRPRRDRARPRPRAAARARAARRRGRRRGRHARRRRRATSRSRARSA